MTPLWALLAAMLLSAISVVIAAAAFVRAGRRMEKGDAVKMEARLTGLEVKVEAVPTHAAVHELAISVTTLAGEVKAMNVRQDGMVRFVERLERVTDRQEKHLLDGGGK